MKRELSAEIQNFISSQLNKNINELALMKNPFPEYDWKWIINQIHARKKAEKKLPSWFANNQIIFPSTLSVEQTSSEILANYKAMLISGETLIDLTGGFGVDAFYFAKRFKKVLHCEFQQDLSEIVRHNFHLLKVDNIETIFGDSVLFLQQTQEKFDWIYMDPARRDASKSKVFLLKDCTPNVVELQDLLFSKTNNILIKTAPLLDIRSILNELKNVKRISVVALNNEVKELLIEIEKDYQQKPQLVAVNIVPNHTVIRHEFELEDDANAVYNAPLNYLYEPFSSYLKTGLYNTLANRFEVKKLHKHSHLYTSEQLKEFPGRIFKINQIIPYNKKELKPFENKKWNVTTRNFPLKVEELRKKHKLKDGGNHYLFFTTDWNNNKIIVVCEKTV
ncbi:MAG TPA: RsmD family RNA methyltransferase [Flavobacterium sp.]|nr:RsmD family RNA methyltransferase [Flavobacterium sp.]